MSEPVRVLADGAIRITPDKRRFLDRLFGGGRQWRPGPAWPSYWEAGGTGCWLLGPDGDVWATNDLDFDLEYWSRLGFQAPRAWTVRGDA